MTEDNILRVTTRSGAKVCFDLDEIRLNHHTPYPPPAYYACAYPERPHEHGITRYDLTCHRCLIAMRAVALTDCSYVCVTDADTGEIHRLPLRDWFEDVLPALEEVTGISAHRPARIIP